jgi:hypothetical protein
MTIFSVFLRFAAAVGVGWVWSMSTFADAGRLMAAERCLAVATIKRTQIVDDQNILFYTRNHKIYNNHLAHSCAGLTIADTFKYATSQSQLCNVDFITVLHQTGSGWTPGASCGLGWFEPTPSPEKTR